MTWMRPNYIKLPYPSTTSDTNNKSNDSPYHLYRYVDDIDPYRVEKLSDKYFNSTFKENAIPILFVHGNSGSYRQGRSLGVTLPELIYQLQHLHSDEKAGVYAQYFAGEAVDGQPWRDLQKKLSEYIKAKNLDFDVFMVDFNEQLSAFSGDVLIRQAQFVRGALKYISSLYKTTTSSNSNNINEQKEIITIGHSMGGVVLKAAVTNFQYKEINVKEEEEIKEKGNNWKEMKRQKLKAMNDIPVRTLITLSTPFKRHPFLLDRESDLFYKQLVHLPHPNVDIYSIGGGWHDSLIRSDLTGDPIFNERSDLVEKSKNNIDNFDFDNEIENDNFYHIISTNSIPNVKCSADHQAITWCKQLVITISKFILNIASVSKIKKLKNWEKKELFEQHFKDLNIKLNFYKNSPTKYNSLTYLQNNNLQNTILINNYKKIEKINTNNKEIFIKKNGFIDLQEMFNNNNENDKLIFFTNNMRTDLNILLTNNNNKNNNDLNYKVLLDTHLEILPFFDVKGDYHDTSKVTTETIKLFTIFTKEQLSSFKYMIIDGSDNENSKHFIKIYNSKNIKKNSLNIQDILFTSKNLILTSNKNNGHESLHFSNLPNYFAYSLTINHIPFLNNNTNSNKNNYMNSFIEIKSKDAYELRTEQVDTNKKEISIKFFESKQYSNGFQIDLFFGPNIKEVQLNISIDFKTTLLMIFKNHFSNTIISNLFSLILFTIANLFWDNFNFSFNSSLNVTLWTRGFLILFLQNIFILYNWKNNLEYFSFNENNFISLFISLFISFILLKIILILFNLLIYLFYLPTKLFKFILFNRFIIFILSILLLITCSKLIHLEFAFLIIFLFMLFHLSCSFSFSKSNTSNNDVDNDVQQQNEMKMNENFIELTFLKKTMYNVKFSTFMLVLIPTLLFLPSFIVYCKEWNEVFQQQLLSLSTNNKNLSLVFNLLLDTIPSARFANQINIVTLIPFLLVFSLVFTESIPLTYLRKQQPNQPRQQQSVWYLPIVFELGGIAGSFFFRFTVYEYFLISSSICSILLMIFTMLRQQAKKQQQAAAINERTEEKEKDE
ncbi:hypothetical protein ABK040_010663 [Willaertia magna]